MLWNSQKISRVVIVGFCLAGLVTPSLDVLAKKAPTAAATYSISIKAAATYSISIKGYLSGSGIASLNGTTLSLSGTVTDEQGNTGDFSAPNLTVNATNHFSGTGTALGLAMKIGGRLDSVTSQETTLKTDRIACNYKLSSCDGRGRVAGYVPVDPTVTSTKPPTTPPEGD